MISRLSASINAIWHFPVPFTPGIRRHNQTDPLPSAGAVLIVKLGHLRCPLFYGLMEAAFCGHPQA
jgi:hypothetical protein